LADRDLGSATGESAAPAAPAAPHARPRNAEATRNALLRAAQNRFILLGYDRTTLRDVAADAGVNLALVKRYFESKEGLFKAALAASPRFLGREGEAPRGRPALAAALGGQLAAKAWPQFGEHPVLMLLRGSGDEQVDQLRRDAMAAFAQQILDALGDDPPPGPDLELRAQLLVALGVGVAVLRSGVGLQPLRDADAAALEPALRRIIDALLPAAAEG
jgi:AcrR family transcriptional regulator